MKVKNYSLQEICYSLDLALLGFKSYDLYNYTIFIKQLQEKNSELFLTLIKIRVFNKKNLNSKIKNNNSKNLDIFNLDHIKEIISKFSKVLNYEYSKQKLDLLNLYFVCEENLFLMNLIILDLNKFTFFLIFWIREYEIAFSLNFYREYSKYCSLKFYPIILYFSLRNAIIFINFYKNL